MKKNVDNGNSKEERLPITRYDPDCRQGLTTAQAQEHMDAGWNNARVVAPTRSIKEIIRENLFTYFNLIFLILAVLLCVVGSFRNLTFLPIIIANVLIGIFQEIRSKRTLDKLNMLNAPTANVIRDGKIFSIDAEKLVVDDIVQFQAGNQICADAVVVEGEVQVNESLLTGESDEITKKPGDKLMSGSFVTAGACRARLESVGADSYISKLTLEAKEMKRGEESEMIRSLNRLIRIIGIIMIPVGILLFVQGFFFNGDGWTGSIVAMVAAVVGMIPEGLYLLTSVALAVSTIRLANQNVLLHDMKSIETLARVNVLCVDKTGTITEPVMRVHELIPTDRYDKEKYPEPEKLIADFAHAMGNDNETMRALQDYFQNGTGEKPGKIVPFSSTTKYSGAVFQNISYVLGAPEFVLRDSFNEYREEIEGYAENGFRVLEFGVYEKSLDGKPLTGNVLPLFHILLTNPIRKNAKETFAYFAEQGVEVKVISGDNPKTVSVVAAEAGIPNAEQYIDAATIKTEEEAYDAVAKYTVFGRVTPEQKRWFIQSLKKQGNTVAMTGDGVNDVLALKDADCSVAMASGSDAAVQASQVVLLKSDFSCMPSVVLEGRRVVNNIQRSASLFLVKNIFSLLLALFAIIFMITYPLVPSQVSLVSAFAIGVPGFFLALQPNKERIRGHFLTNVILNALPAGITDFLIVAALVLFNSRFNLDSDALGTIATFLLLVVGFLVLLKACLPFNPLRVCIWVGCIAVTVGCILVVPRLFYISALTTDDLLIFLCFAVVTIPVYFLIVLLFNKIRNWYARRATQRSTSAEKSAGNG